MWPWFALPSPACIQILINTLWNINFTFAIGETENDGCGIKLRQIHGWVRTKPNTTPVPIFDPQPDSELIATAWLLVPLMICWQVTWWDGGLDTSTRVHMNVSTSTRNTFTVTPATQMERCFILWVLIALVQLRLVTVLHIILENNWLVLSVQSSCLFSSEAL